MAPAAGIQVELYIESTGLRIFRLAVFSLVILVSIAGNGMVCWAVWKLPHRKPFSYYVVANLAVAELINSLCIPFIVIYEELGTWIFGQMACTIVNPLLVMAVVVVTSSLATIAVYRYRVIVKPNKRRPAGFMITVIIIGLWLIGLAFALPLSITRRVLTSPGSSKLVCTSHFPGDELFVPPYANYNKYNIARFAVTFFVIYVIMAVSYAAVALKLKFFIRHTSSSTTNNGSSVFPATNIEAVEPGLYLADGFLVGRQPDSRRRLTRSSVIALQNSQLQRRQVSSRVENHLLRMIYIIIIVFVGCYIPYQAVFLWEYFAGVNNWQFSYHKLLRDYVFILKCLPSAIHPLCYGTMNRFFAKAFTRIIMCKRR